MGSASTKPASLSPEDSPRKRNAGSQEWLEKKKKHQAKAIDLLEISVGVNQPMERVDSIVRLLESKGILIERGLLGEGGSAFILKAFNQSNPHLALKIQKCENKSAVKKNRAEYATLKSFNSQYVTRVHDIFELKADDYTSYVMIVMERCQYDLKKFMLEHPRKEKSSAGVRLSVKKVVNIYLELAKGLEVLHSHNLLHLDIKPANILLGFDDIWKYADLGVSKSLSKNADHTSHLEGFTAVYSSPEQYQMMSFNTPRKITKASDIFSLGVVFLELTGVELNRQWLTQHKVGKVACEQQLNNEFADLNERIILPMMAHESEDRLELSAIISTLNEITQKQSEQHLQQQQQQNLILEEQQQQQQQQRKKQKQNPQLTLAISQVSQQPNNQPQILSESRKSNDANNNNNAFKVKLNKQATTSFLSPQPQKPIHLESPPAQKFDFSSPQNQNQREPMNAQSRPSQMRKQKTHHAFEWNNVDEINETPIETAYLSTNAGNDQQQSYSKYQQVIQQPTSLRKHNSVQNMAVLQQQPSMQSQAPTQSHFAHSRRLKVLASPEKQFSNIHFFASNPVAAAGVAVVSSLSETQSAATFTPSVFHSQYGRVLQEPYESNSKSTNALRRSLIHQPSIHQVPPVGFNASRPMSIDNNYNQNSNILPYIDQSQQQTSRRQTNRSQQYQQHQGMSRGSSAANAFFDENSKLYNQYQNNQQQIQSSLREYGILDTKGNNHNDDHSNVVKLPQILSPARNNHSRRISQVLNAQQMHQQVFQTSEFGFSHPISTFATQSGSHHHDSQKFRNSIEHYHSNNNMGLPIY